MVIIGKITKVTVEKLGVNQVVWDTALVGFGARRQLRHVHYLLRYRIDGKQRFLSIGRHGMWTPDTARTEAKRLLGLVASRIDPASERSRKGDPFGAEVERYLESKSSALKPRSLIEVERYLRVYAKPLHNLPLGKIDRRTIALTLAEVEQSSGPAARNRFRSSLSAFFSWAIREGLTEINPVAGTGKASEGNGRDRVLTQAELSAVLAALGSDPFSEIVRVLVLSGQRRSEVGGLKWSEVDFERGLIIFSADRVKNGRQHELPISNQMRVVLERQPRRNEWVFGAEFTTWSTSKEALDKRLNGMASWTLHDIRRSAATHMAELGVLPHIIEAILNHVSGHKSGVAGIYNRARYAGEMELALQKWADYVDRLNAKIEVGGYAAIAAIG